MTEFSTSTSQPLKILILSRLRTKPTQWPLRAAKNQISLGMLCFRRISSDYLNLEPHFCFNICNQVANKTGLSSLSIFQETRWLVCNLLKSVSLALKVPIKCCKSNYLRLSVYRRNINLSLMAAGDYILRPLSALFRCCHRLMKRCIFLSFNKGQALDPILIYISLWIGCLFEIRKTVVYFLWLSLPGDYRVTDEALLAETT